MKLIFEEADLEKMLLEKAASMGASANHVVFHASYGRFDRAEVSFVEEDKSEKDPA